ncbi:hypothetical protein LRS13_00175 [Svornostia abyssi]|uniref:Uncharacterized protein n=1 Tax=Svornostia abyssi TaxID=2898438 RepID=A0ABY5PHX0_9ACTN|nr:hypothetical protein LRS13_00175 [Parviterribacteraceae bacterium J379]
MGTRFQRRTVELPEGIAALGNDAIDTVHTLVHQAERRQAHELREALERTLKIVPRPLRGAVKKVVGA